MLGNLLFASLAVLSAVSATAIERRSGTKCYTTHTGALQWNDTASYGVNSNNIVIFPAGDTVLNVELQVWDSLSTPSRQICFIY